MSDIHCRLTSGTTWPIDRYGQWVEDASGPYVVPAMLSGSDYSGNLIHRANNDEWREVFADGDGKWWADISGGFGTFAIIIDTREMPKEADEFLMALDDYPIANEDWHSQLETEAQDNAWQRWARREFAQALIARWAPDSQIDSDELEGDGLWTLFHDAAERSGTYWENQQGPDVYIDVARVVNAVSADEFDSLLGEDVVNHEAEIAKEE